VGAARQEEESEVTQGGNDWDINLDELPATGGAITDRMDRAGVLSRRDPLRKGNVVYLPPAGDVVILGDLHGDLDNLRHVVEWAALQRHPDRYLVLQELIHGGPDDGQGGDTSFRLIEEAATLKCRFRSQVQIVLSNHDLTEVTGGSILKNGKPTNKLFRKGIENAYGASFPLVYQAYMRFLGAIPYAVRTVHGLFVSHSTPSREALDGFDYSVFERPAALVDCQPGGSVYELVWGRYHDQASADRFAEAVGAQILVTGHQSSMPGVKAPTSRHVMLTSDGPLGAFLHASLGVQVTQAVLVRQVKKIRTLRPGNGG
jgi:hypothetical protein